MFWGSDPRIVEVLDHEERLDTLKAQVEVCEHMGSEIIVYIDYKGQNIIAKFDSDRNTSMKPNDEIRITFKANRIHLFDKESEISLLANKANMEKEESY